MNSPMNHLVVIADPGIGRNTALKRGLELQERSGADLTLLGFVHADIDNPHVLEHAGMTADEMKRAVMDKRRGELEEIAEKNPPTGKKISTVLIWSRDLAGEISSFCNRKKTDLVIKSGHRSETWLYTPTDWQLFRECPAPVMITAGKSWKKKSKILAAVDFSSTRKTKQQLNDRIVTQAKLLAATLNDEVHLACALNIPQPLVDLDIINPKKYVADKRLHLQPVVEAFCSRHELDPARVHMRQGSPDRIVPSIANAIKADLVVAGTVGRRGVKGKLLGNTAEGILRRLYSDIMAVKP